MLGISFLLDVLVIILVCLKYCYGFNLRSPWRLERIELYHSCILHARCRLAWVLGPGTRLRGAATLSPLQVISGLHPFLGASILLRDHPRLF